MAGTVSNEEPRPAIGIPQKAKMVERLRTAAPPSVTVVEISDPTATSAGIELIDQDAVQLQSMPHRVRRVIVRLDTAAVVFHSTNRRARTRTRARKGLLAYVTFGPQATGTVNGLPVRPGLMLAAEPEAEARFVADAGWESIAAQVELLEALLATLGDAHDFEPTRSERTRQARSLVVKIAEDYALSHIADHLYVSDLCRVAAVSERTLEGAFIDIMGLTPVTYLIRLRLHRVRHALLTATHGSTTVTAEALNWGFWHFGEFSRAYRDCFGELPSSTLQRRPTEPRA
jgi:AraC-like DNA-binding protein